MSTLESIVVDARAERRALDRDAVARLQDDLEQLETLYALSEGRLKRLETINEQLRTQVKSCLNVNAGLSRKNNELIQEKLDLFARIEELESQLAALSGVK